MTAPKRKTWEETMTPVEVKFCLQAIYDEIERLDVEHADNFRAARIWVSSQRRRFRRYEANGCCGSHNFVAIRRHGFLFLKSDVYMLGFNYGH